MRKLVTLCFRHSVHTEELLQLELLYWGGRGGGGEGEGERRMEGKGQTMDQPVPLPSLPFPHSVPHLHYIHGVSPKAH